MRSVGTFSRIAFDQPPGRLVEDDELALARPDGEAGLGAAQPLDTVAEEAGRVHHDPRLEVPAEVVEPPAVRDASRPVSSAPVTSRAPCRTAWVM